MCAASGLAPASDDAAALAFFEKKVRPLLVDNCYNCHSANTNARGGLRVDDRNGLLLGGDSGPAVVPGQPAKSLLLQAVRHTNPKLQMPPKTQLSEEQIAILTKWIEDGVAWPAVAVPASLGKPNPLYDKLKKEHWAWQPLREAAPPPVRDTTWPRDDIDRFLLARLEEHELKPVGDADKRTLLRRVTFDLTGLPPTPTEIEAFLADDAADAFARVVDRLLASPAFGERWGRHWLDVARYGESTGSARNVPYPHAWRYRDYVIDAFNQDKPYDQFLREQIAGDLLPADSPRQRQEQLIATGFLALGVKDVNQRFKVRFIMDNIDEQIDTVTQSILALTVSCARCHDHKFDPIPTTDYYALAGIFHSTDLCAGVRNKMGGSGMAYYDTDMLVPLDAASEPPPDAPRRIQQIQSVLSKTRSELTKLRNDPEAANDDEGQQRITSMREQIAQLEQNLLTLTDPAARGPVALGVREGRTIGDTEVRIRGEAEKLGPVVPRGFLGILEFPGQPQVNPNQSGRLELAQWLTDPRNPLPSRVMVNRVWRHLFGQGLVRSVDNFGVTGDTPSHPELLDHLATRFMRDGWSVKKLIRVLVLTHAYQLSGAAAAEHLTVDPANRFVWRHSPRRLDAEEIRDTMLAAAGNLDRTRPEASPAKDLLVREMQNTSTEAEQILKQAVASKHRSIYLPLIRNLTPIPLAVFDFAEQGMVTGHRDTTTVAPQALFLLNDPFVSEQARTLAKRLTDDKDQDEPARIDQAYHLVLSRPATAAETDRARRYLADYAAAARAEGTAPDAARHAAWTSFCQALLGSAEFRYVR
ncbi:MAG: PSD1 and planctomycete cytochrome C domain-containing protein [Gemmataceae bacterium]